MLTIRVHFKNWQIFPQILTKLPTIRWNSISMGKFQIGFLKKHIIFPDCICFPGYKKYRSLAFWLREMRVLAIWKIRPENYLRAKACDEHFKQSRIWLPILGQLPLITLPFYLVIKRYWLYRRSKKMTWQFLALHSDGLLRKWLQSGAIMSVSWSFLFLTPVTIDTKRYE